VRTPCITGQSEADNVPVGASIHVGIRGPIYGQADIDDDRRFGFRTIRASDV
jgi:hypothetical protein